jgi:hemolysin activation/secretion protein
MIRYLLFPTAVAVVIAGGTSLSAHGQTRPDAGSTLQQQGVPTAPPPRGSPDVLPSGEIPQPALQALPSPTVTVKSFKFSGQTRFTAERLAQVLADLPGKTLTLAQLNGAAQRIQTFYRSNGYLVARAYLPRQDVTDGAVEITVLEGYVGKVGMKVNPATRLSPNFARGMLDAALLPKAVVEEANLERALLLLNDLPGTVARSSLSPGEAIGTANIDIEVAQRTGYAGEGPLSRATGALVTGEVGLDNHGNRFVGQWRAKASLAVNGLTGYGDQMTLRTQVSPENKHSNFQAIGWSVPVGWWGTRAGISVQAFEYSLIKSFAPLRAEGDGKVLAAYAQHPLVRSRRHNLYLNANVQRLSSEDRTLSIGNIETRRVNQSGLGLSGDWRDTVLGGGTNAWSVTWSGGKVRLKEAALQLADRTGAQTAGSFSKLSFAFQRSQRIGGAWTLHADMAGQSASKNLTSSEKFSLGGPTGVRAYPVGEASGDSGIQATLELRYGAARIGGMPLQASAFLDAGHVRVNENPLPGTTANKRNLQGTGLALTLGQEGDFVLRGTMAWRIESEKPTSDRDRSPRVWMTATKWF